MYLWEAYHVYSGLIILQIASVIVLKTVVYCTKQGFVAKLSCLCYGECEICKYAKNSRKNRNMLDKRCSVEYKTYSFFEICWLKE